MAENMSIEVLQEALEVVRRRTLLTGERKYAADEVLRSVLNWYAQTKPSEMFASQVGTGKGATTTYDIPEPQMRELWQKWVDAAKGDIYGKAFQIPGLLLDDVIRMFKEPDDAQPSETSTS